MKPIYYIHSYEYDYCNVWTSYFLHSHNKKFLEDLVIKLTTKEIGL